MLLQQNYSVTLQNETASMNNYPNILTPPSSSEGGSPQPVYFVASPNSNSFSPPDHHASQSSPQFNIMQHTEPQVMSVDTSSPAGAPYLKLIEEPTDKFRFRYKSEMAGTHGSLAGTSSDKSRKQTYPTVELVNFSHKAVIRCSIYQTANKDFMPHAHRLIMKRGKEESDDPHNIPVGPEEGFVGTFHSMGIIHTAKKHIVGELVKKKTQLRKEYVARMEGKIRDLTTKEIVEIKTLAESESKSINLNIVCLRFDAFIVDKDIWYPICAPIYTHGINNLKSALTGELKIVRMDHCTSPAKGGKEVFVLVERVTKKNIKIRFFELNDDDREVWEDYGKFTDLDVHHQYAIVFKTPKYHDDKITSSRRVYMELVRPSDGARSEAKEFTYVPSHEFRPGAKRPRSSGYGSSSYDSSNLGSDEIPATINKFNIEPQNTFSSWNTSVNNPENGLLTSNELKRALEDVNSDEFMMLFSTFEKDYNNSIATDAYTAAEEAEAQSERLQNIHLDVKPYAGSKYRKLTEHSSVNSQNIKTSQPYVVIKMEVSADDSNMAYQTYDELRSFAKTKYTPARAVEMLKYYLNEEEKNNALHIFVSLNKNEELSFLLKMIYLYKQFDLVNIKNSQYQTALHLAILCKNYDFIKYLISCRADVSSVDANGNTALHLAVKNNLPTEVLETILSGTNADKCKDDANNDGNTALVIATEEKNLTAIKVLHRSGVDINKRHNKSGFTPLRFAIDKQYLDITKYFLSLPGLDPAQVDFKGNSPFGAACKKESSQEIVEVINRFVAEKHLDLHIKEEFEDDSDEEMEEDSDVKSEPVSYEDVEQLYKNVTRFTPQCLDQISALVDESGNWEDLANLLDLSHMIRSGLIPVATNPTKNLLTYAVESNNDKILEIRNFLENLDELKAVEIIDRMAREANQT